MHLLAACMLRLLACKLAPDLTACVAQERVHTGACAAMPPVVSDRTHSLVGEVKASAALGGARAGLRDGQCGHRQRLGCSHGSGQRHSCSARLPAAALQMGMARASAFSTWADAHSPQVQVVTYSLKGLVFA